MEIEYPHGGPIPTAFAGTEEFDTIGQFYRAVLEAFIELNPAISTDRQLEGSPGVFKIDSIETVKEAIELINLQGEGSNLTPEEMAGDLAHYYRFAEIYHGRRLVQDSAGAWSFTGPEFELLAEDVHDMADIPEGGYQRGDVPDPATWELIERFDRQYSSMLRLLEQAWLHGNQAILGQAVGAMHQMGATGTDLVAIPRPGATGNYGPCFRYVPSE